MQALQHVIKLATAPSYYHQTFLTEYLSAGILPYQFGFFSFHFYYTKFDIILFELELNDHKVLSKCDVKKPSYYLFKFNRLFPHMLVVLYGSVLLPARRCSSMFFYRMVNP